MVDDRTHALYVERSMANIGRTGRWWWITVLALSALVVAGLYAYAVQVQRGHEVTGTSHEIFWGFYIVNFVFFIGISYGGAITSAILRLTHAKWRAPITRIAEATALVTLGVGAASVLVDVARPDRMLNLFRYAQVGSPITWDWIAITTYLVGTVIFFALPLIPDVARCRDTFGAKERGLRVWPYRMLSFGWRGTPEQEHALLRGIGVMAVLIIPLAVTVHSVLAWLFATTVREGWHTTIFAPLFVLGAMLSGVATVILVIAGARKLYGLERFVTEKHFRYLSYLLIALDAAYAYFMIGEYLTEGYTQEQGVAPMLESFFIGSYAPVFWTFSVGGILLPFLLAAMPGRAVILRSTIASVLVVAGMWLKRFLIVLIPGVAQPLMPWEIYRPTWVELTITVGALAAIPLGLMVIFAIFPVMSVHELEEVEGMTAEPTPARAPARATWRTALAPAALVAAAVLLITLNGPMLRFAQGLRGQSASLAAPAGGMPGGMSTTPGGTSTTPGSDGTSLSARTTATANVEPSENAELGYVIEARVANKDGRPVNQLTVQFYELVDLAGAREMLLGSATTDGFGRATVTYLPAAKGTHQIVIRSTKQGALEATEARTTFDATLADAVPYTAEVLPLAAFSERLPAVAGLVLLGVWLMFAFAFVVTPRRIERLARLAVTPSRPVRGVAREPRFTSREGK